MEGTGDETLFFLIFFMHKDLTSSISNTDNLYGSQLPTNGPFPAW